MFELPNFQAWTLFKQIKEGIGRQKNRRMQLEGDGLIYEYQGSRSKPGFDDRDIYCFFRTNLQPGTLKQDFTDRQTSFLVNLMTDNNSTHVSYEHFLNFVVPRTKKKLTAGLIAKIKQTETPLIGGRVLGPQNYDAMCSLAKLFECEVQIMKKI